MNSRGKSSCLRSSRVNRMSALFTLPLVASTTTTTVLLVLLQLLPAPVASYPIFGTKRYHRNNVAQDAVNVFTPSLRHQPQYDPSLDEYSADDPSNYLYFAPHDPQYHSYGMPVYHGEYEPTPYLYAQGPTYQYYDDKEANNPLDDLHEEMLEEDEREREEREHQQQQQMRQYLRHQQQMNMDEDYEEEVATKHRGYHQPMYDYQAQAQQGGLDYADEAESRVAMANAAFLNDLIQYNRQMNSRGRTAKQNKAKQNNAYADSQTRKVQSKSSQWNTDYFPTAAEDEFDYDSLDRQNGHKSDDEAVRELQALTHSRDKTSSVSSTSSGLRKVDPMAKYRQQEEANFDDEYLWPSDEASVAAWDVNNNNKESELNSHNYEYDDEWINWDSKRSAPSQPISILAFTDRKPSKIVKVPENHFVLDATTTTSSSSSLSTTTASPGAQKSEKIIPAIVGRHGQKEEVLMRPAPPVRNPFSVPVMKMLEQHQENRKNNAAAGDPEMQKRSKEGATERKPKTTMYETLKHLLDMEQRLKEASSGGGEQLKGPSTSLSSARIQKRFVTSEGSLVKQLEGLKRMQV